MKVEVKFIHDEGVNIFKTYEANKSTSAAKNTDSTDFECNSENLPSQLIVSDKPLSLFEKGDVGGKHLFGFQTPKSRSAIANKVAELIRTPVTPKTPKTPKTPRTPKTPKTPKTPSCNASECLNLPSNSNRRSKVARKLEPDTPYSLRTRLKRKIVAVKYGEHDSSGESGCEDFSGSDSDWEDTNHVIQEFDDSDSEDDVKDNLDRKKETNLLYRVENIVPSQQKTNKLAYVPSTEHYFNTYASKRVHTSNHTLGKLHQPNLVQEELQKLLSNVEVSHGSQLYKINNKHQALFSKWLFSLREGFSVLLHGVGSKRSLLSAFHEQLPEPSVVVNGFFPSLTIQEVVSSIAEGVLGLNLPSTDIFETVDAIKCRFSIHGLIRLYLVVHNIDGAMLRNDRSQEILSSLASAPNIHLIASVDHISTPFIWDQNMLRTFNFLWWDVTTFQLYSEETAFESSLLIQQSGNLALSSLQNVFRSLTSNAQNIFLLLAAYQKENKNYSNYCESNILGRRIVLSYRYRSLHTRFVIDIPYMLIDSPRNPSMSFRKLYNACRESLLVSSDLALRTQLTEFLDHHLVRSRRSVDGSEMLLIPIDAGVLEQFLAQQELV